MATGGNNIRPTTVMTRRRVGLWKIGVLREDSDPREIKQGENEVLERQEELYRDFNVSSYFFREN